MLQNYNSYKKINLCLQSTPVPVLWRCCCWTNCDEDRNCDDIRFLNYFRYSNKYRIPYTNVWRSFVFYSFHDSHVLSCVGTTLCPVNYSFARSVKHCTNDFFDILFLSGYFTIAFAMYTFSQSFKVSGQFTRCNLCIRSSHTWTMNLFVSSGNCV